MSTTGWGKSASGNVFHLLRDGKYPICGTNVLPVVFVDVAPDVHKCRYCLRTLADSRLNR